MRYAESCNCIRNSNAIFENWTTYCLSCWSQAAILLFGSKKTRMGMKWNERDSYTIIYYWLWIGFNKFQAVAVFKAKKLLEMISQVVCTVTRHRTIYYNIQTRGQHQSRGGTSIKKNWVEAKADKFPPCLSFKKICQANFWLLREEWIFFF